MSRERPPQGTVSGNFFLIPGHKPVDLEVPVQAREAVPSHADQKTCRLSYRPRAEMASRWSPPPPSMRAPHTLTARRLDQASSSRSWTRLTALARRAFGAGSASRPSSQAGRNAPAEPCGDPLVGVEPAAQMLGAAQSAGPGQALGAAMSPPAHHVIGHFRVELQADRMPAMAIGLVGEILAASREELGAVGQVEPVGVPLVYVRGERCRAQPLGAGVGSTG